MAASKYDFNIEQGSSFRLSLVYKDQDKNIVDLTGYCARLIWKTNTNITQIFTTENVDLNVYQFTIDSINGKITLLLPASTTNALTFTTAKYDLELQAPSDLYIGGGKFTTRILFGTATIVKRFSQTSVSLECN
jgi:hypothetical protein